MEPKVFFNSTRQRDGNSPSVALGRRGEIFIANLLRQHGFRVKRSPRSRGVFDMVATRSDKTIYAQIKTTSHVSLATQGRLGILKMLPAALAIPAPHNTIKVFWIWIPQIKRHAITVLRRTPEADELLPIKFEPLVRQNDTPR